MSHEKRNAEAIAKFKKPYYLNLGSGSVPQARSINVDIADLPEVDVVWDLDTVPWPFEDGSVACIRAYDIFEHIDKPVEFMQESHRILMDDGLLSLHVTYWKSMNAYTDPTHKRFCTEETFDYWVPGTQHYERYGRAYGKGGTVKFEKEACALHFQELAVQLRKIT